MLDLAKYKYNQKFRMGIKRQRATPNVTKTSSQYDNQYQRNEGEEPQHIG